MKNDRWPALSPLAPSSTGRLETWATSRPPLRGRPPPQASGSPEGVRDHQQDQQAGAERCRAVGKRLATATRQRAASKGAGIETRAAHQVRAFTSQPLKGPHNFNTVGIYAFRSEARPSVDPRLCRTGPCQRDPGWLRCGISGRRDPRHLTRTERPVPPTIVPPPCSASTSIRLTPISVVGTFRKY